MATVAPEKQIHPLPAIAIYRGGRKVNDMAAMTYSEQLKHPNWQRKRLEILNRAEFSCEICRDDQTTLHVHHRAYIKGRMAWDYPAEMLVALCVPCHEAEHATDEDSKIFFASLPLDGPGCAGNATALLSGWLLALGMAKDDRYQEDPLSTVVGHIAGELEKRFGIHDMKSIHDVLISTPEEFIRWVRAEDAKRA